METEKEKHKNVYKKYQIEFEWVEMMDTVTRVNVILKHKKGEKRLRRRLSSAFQYEHGNFYKL